MASDVALFRSLAALHRAGIPWPQAVESATSGKPEWMSVRRALERGDTIAGAFLPHLDPLDAAILTAGERDGSLEQAFEAMANAHEATTKRRREGGVQIAYPILLAHVAALLMAVPDLMQGKPLAALGWVALILVPVWAFLLLRRRQYGLERPQPGAGHPPHPSRSFLARSRIEEADARALEALGRLYQAGIPIRDALDLAVRAGWGGRVAVDLDVARRRVDRGEELGGAWNLLPEAWHGPLVSGEAAGQLGEAALSAAESMRFDASIRRKRWAQIVPLVLMLGIGGIIAARLFSFYGSYFSQMGRY